MPDPGERFGVRYAWMMVRLDRLRRWLALALILCLGIGLGALACFLALLRPLDRSSLPRPDAAVGLHVPRPGAPELQPAGTIESATSPEAVPCYDGPATGIVPARREERTKTGLRAVWNERNELILERDGPTTARRD